MSGGSSSIRPVLHCEPTQNRLFGPESEVLIIGFHPSYVLVTIRAETYFFSEKYCQEIIMVALPEFGCLLQDPGYALPEILVKIKKLPDGNHYGSHGKYQDTPHLRHFI